VPKFKNEDEEAEFWASLDLSEYFEPSDFKPFNFSELIEKSKPTTKPVTLRLPDKWILTAKAIASQQDIPYQSLIKQIIHSGLQRYTHR